ncbi:hypothetical protein [Patulibacter sp. SYSU D01012]|uniref:hypothetical protein n=1 Tax=Patulibacter sp. SYSU D01012 TaxID=2817381 RepID=UPI001B303C37|nr:hypothetical protein [Patulibacter sp. SYSU D01012]
MTPAPPTRDRRRTAILVIAALDALLLLFPPVQWWLASGDATVGIGYFLVAGLLVTLSVVAIHHLDASAGEDER